MTATTNTVHNPLLEADFKLLKEYLDALISENYPTLQKFESANDHKKDHSPYTAFLKQHQLSLSDRLILLIGLAPHFDHRILASMAEAGLANKVMVAKYGGRYYEDKKYFIPTVRTALALIRHWMPTDVPDLLKHADSHHFFLEERILRMVPDDPLMPWESVQIQAEPDFIRHMKTGAPFRPSYGQAFPAQEISTNMEWKDLIVNLAVREEITHLQHWLEYGQQLRGDEKLGRKIKPGFRALFHGPPGTGKTLAANLLGKRLRLPVFRIDLSMIVSKYIGETEKNLDRVFRRAENKEWILFFDEADALFGKRGKVTDARDRYANQEVSYLLQRVEGYNGLVILATNHKMNIDAAFFRRFQSIIEFPAPNDRERTLLWEQAMQGPIPVSDTIDFRTVGEKFKLTGGQILNIAQYCYIAAMGREKKEIDGALITEGVRRELHKEGKTL